MTDNRNHDDGSTTLHVGDIDITPDKRELWCDDRKSPPDFPAEKYGCTRPKGHTANHAAGAGASIVAVWNDGDSWADDEAGDQADRIVAQNEEYWRHHRPQRPLATPPPGFQSPGGNRYWETNANNTRLNVWAPEKYSQLLTLPMGTEIVLFKITGPAVQGVVLTVNDEMREQTRRYMEGDDEMPFDFAVYILPDDVVPDAAPEQTGD